MRCARRERSPPSGNVRRFQQLRLLSGFRHKVFDALAKRRNHERQAVRALLLVAFLCLGFVPRDSLALTIPIPDNPVLGADAVQLSLAPAGGPLSYGQFRVDLVPASVSYVPSPYQNVIGQRIEASFDVTFGAYNAIAGVDLEYMLVYTSLRVSAPSGVTCSQLAPNPLVSYPGADFAYASDGWSGQDRLTTSTDNEAAGQSQVCNAEGNGPWDSLIFNPVPGESQSTYRFTMQIKQTKDNIDTSQIQNLRFLLQGYSANPAAVPEPTTALMLILGLAGLHRVARARATRR